MFTRFARSRLASRIRLPLAALLILAVVAACAPSATPSSSVTAAPKSSSSTPAAATQSGPYGTLAVAVSTFGDDSMDPILSASTPVTGPIFEAMLAVDAKANLVGRIAESWSLSADGLTWTVKIRKGIKFHNGTEVTSADAKFSLERLMSAKSKSAWAPVFRTTVDHVDAPDPSTVTVTTKKIDTMFMADCTGWTVVPKQFSEDKGDAYVAENPVGTGPWKFVKHERGANVEYEAVKDHWRLTPYFDKLVLKLIPEESTRVAMLQRGDADIIDLSLDSAGDVKAAGFGLLFDLTTSDPLIAFKGTWLNTGQPAQDVRIRQALSLAINREELAKTFFKGYAKPGGRFFMGEYSYGWDPSLAVDPYDPKKAKDLLAAAGYPDKFADPVVQIFSTKAPGASWMADFAQVISGYWEAIGVKTKLVAMDYATLYGIFFAAQPDPKVVGAAYPFNGSGAPIPVQYTWNGYGSTSFWGLLNDKEWDSAFTNIPQERDDAKRLQLYRQAIEKAHDQYVDINTVLVKKVYGASNNVGDWDAPGATTLATGYEGVKHK